jgi:hypothetical protein
MNTLFRAAIMLLLLAQPLPASEEKQDPNAIENINVLELYKKAKADGQKLPEWYFSFRPDFPLPGGGLLEGFEGWEYKVKAKGTIFKITCGPPTLKHRTVPRFTVSQIVGPNAFIDLKHKFYVEGLSTEGLTDDSEFTDSDLLNRCVGYVKGSKTYPTASGATNTVLHIILAETDESFAMSEEEKADIEAGFRQWWSPKNGSSVVTARIVKKIGPSKVRMEDKDGKEYTVDVSEFSDADQLYIKNWKAKKRTAKKKSPAVSKESQAKESP